MEGDMPTWEDVMGARERYEGVVSHEGMMAFRGPIAGISRDGKTIVLATARTLSRREMGNGLAKAEHDWHEVAPKTFRVSDEQTLKDLGRGIVKVSLGNGDFMTLVPHELWRPLQNVRELAESAI